MFHLTTHSTHFILRLNGVGQRHRLELNNRTSSMSGIAAPNHGVQWCQSAALGAVGTV